MPRAPTHMEAIIVIAIEATAGMEKSNAKKRKSGGEVLNLSEMLGFLNYLNYQYELGFACT